MSVPPAPREEKAPQEPVPPAQPKAAAGARPAARLAGSISIKVAAMPKAEIPRLDADVKPLTQERLEELWRKAATECDLEELMAEGKPVLDEHPGLFRVESQTTWFADEFKKHKIDVMECLRRETGMRMLDCKVVPLFVEKDDVIYSPDAKYAAMLEKNPQLFELRKLFPMIDY